MCRILTGNLDNHLPLKKQKQTTKLTHGHNQHFIRVLLAAFRLVWAVASITTPVCETFLANMGSSAPERPAAVTPRGRAWGPALTDQVHTQAGPAVLPAAQGCPQSAACPVEPPAPPGPSPSAGALWLRRTGTLPQHWHCKPAGAEARPGLPQAQSQHWSQGQFLSGKKDGPCSAWSSWGAFAHWEPGWAVSGAVCRAGPRGSAGISYKAV